MLKLLSHPATQAIIGIIGVLITVVALLISSGADSDRETPPPVLRTPIIIALSDLDIRSGPGTSFPILGILLAGRKLDVLGISEDRLWYQVLQQDGQPGWVLAAPVVARLDGDSDVLRVIIPSPTPAPSYMPIVTATPAATITPTTTLTQTPTQMPTLTPMPAATEIIGCSGLITPRLVVGERAQVTSGDANNVRTEPGASNPRIGSIPGGGEIRVLDGPVCADGYVWWLVDFEGLVGWTAEGGTTYFIRPLGSQATAGVTRRQTAAAYQMFDNGYMIWLAYNDQIYVLVGGGRYQVFPPNILNENLRNETIGIQPPPLRFEPRSGFGIVWRRDASLRAAIGWALHLETGYTATVTYDARSGAMTITGPEQQFFELDGNGRWSGG